MQACGSNSTDFFSDSVHTHSGLAYQSTTDRTNSSELGMGVLAKQKIHETHVWLQGGDVEVNYTARRARRTVLVSLHSTKSSTFVLGNIIFFD
jgi:hypothetical protein